MTLNMYNLIYKYLKYMDNIESSSKLTLKAYSNDLNQAFFDIISPEKITDLNLVSEKQLWNEARLGLNRWSKLSLASRNRKIATLKSFFNWLYQDKYIDKNYSHLLICPKVPKKIPHFISIDEVLSVISFYSNRQLNTKEKNEIILFLLLYGGGLRISEACQLKWNQISFEQRKITVLGKGNRERIIVIPLFCIELLKELNKDPSVFVFGNAPLNPRAGFEMIRQCGKKVNLMNNLNPHALRHSFATHLLSSGVNLRILQKILGHESLQATEKYTHLSVDSLARTMQATHPLGKMKI